MVDGQNISPEDLAAAGPHVRNGDEEFDAVARAQPIEIDDRREMVARRIDVERVERVRAHEWRQGVRPGAEPTGPGPGVAPGAEPSVQKLALDGRQRAFSRDREPELFQFRPRAFAPAFGETGRIDHGVHRARARAADRADRDARVFRQRIEHAPGVSAVRASPLQGEVDRLDCTCRFGWRVGGLVGSARHAAVHPPSIERLAPVICAAASEQR